MRRSGVHGTNPASRSYGAIVLLRRSVVKNTLARRGSPHQTRPTSVSPTVVISSSMADPSHGVRLDGQPIHAEGSVPLGRVDIRGAPPGATTSWW